MAIRNVKMCFCSSGPDPHKDGAQHPGGGGARVHCEAALRLPDRGQALPHPRLSQGRRPLHKALQRGEQKNLTKGWLETSQAICPWQWREDIPK